MKGEAFGLILEAYVNSMKTPPLARRQIGSQFEAAAAEHLRLGGYQIIDRNRTYPWGELDIIAEKTNTKTNARTLTFVEVRGVGSENAWVRPIESLTASKLGRLRRAIESYLLEYRGQATQVSIDLITVEAKNQAVEIKHYSNFLDLGH